MDQFELERKLNQLLNVSLINDYCPNGLQIQGRANIKTMITGVTATQQLINQAVEMGVDAVLVHHGFFWKSEALTITGMKYKRLQALLANNINLYGYHLPLDCHEMYGNNVQLAKILEIPLTGILDEQGFVCYSELPQPETLTQFSDHLQQKLQRTPLVINGGDHLIRSVAWTTGGGQHYIHLAAEKKIDLFISGEISESTTHIARELGIHYISAGHHATERGGVQALVPWLNELGLIAQFVDDDNPV